MLKHQEEYLELLREKFGVKSIRNATYRKTRDIVDIGILVELESTRFAGVCIFLSNTTRGMYHK